LLVTIRKNLRKGDRISRTITTLVTISTEDPTDVREVPNSSAFESVSFFYRTSLGFLLVAPRAASRGEGVDRTYLVTKTGVVPQPVPNPAPSEEFYRWEFAGLCESGVVYYSRSELSQGPGRQRIHVEPFVRHLAKQTGTSAMLVPG